MHIHILGICGTFMGSLAVLAKQLGYEVSGSDKNVYPPMSTQLQAQGIVLSEGYEPEHLQPAPDLVVIGNTCSRGNSAVEYVLSEGLPYTSGPQWLADHVLQGRWVLGVAGTHGKTTTTSMLTWILTYAGLKPGYLIGGVPLNFDYSADLGDSPFFVIEADEYDSAFFDKRSKFVHYHIKTAILGNLEFDHADIFDDLSDIQKQFHHLLKTIPDNGMVISPAENDNLEAVFSKGLWSQKKKFSIDQRIKADSNVEILDGSGKHFRYSDDKQSVEVHWNLTGKHNVQNGVAALIAAEHAGVSIETAAQALGDFAGVKRRLELIGEFNHIKVFDDFAHHPTAILTTLQGVRAQMQEEGSKGRLIAVIEARSNTMKMGYHQNEMAHSLYPADMVLWFRTDLTLLDLEAVAKGSQNDFRVMGKIQSIIDVLIKEAKPGDNIVFMSNGSFEGIHSSFCEALESRGV